MNTPNSSLPVRIRHYATLLLQLIPLTLLALALLGKFKGLTFGLAVFFLLAAIGPVLELLGHKAGRLITLSTLALESLLFAAALFWILYEDDFEGMDDIVTLSLLLLPALFWLWNWLGGRPKRPTPPNQT